MSTSTKYGWDLTDYGVTGWNGILQSFQVGVDDKLNTYIHGTLGATVDKDEILFMDTDGTYKLAQADAGKVPARGLAIEAGNSGDNVKIRRLGPYAVTGAASAMTLQPGEKLYIDPTTPGLMTHTKPSSFSQAVAFALDTSNVFVWVEDLSPIHYANTSQATSAASGVEDGTLFFQYTP